MKEVVLKTNNLTKQYNKNVVLDNVNITIKKGDIYGLIGRNGAGKTTLMKIITTLASPTSGTFELFNTCSENDELFDNKKRGIVDKNQINKVLELLNLTGTGKKKVKTFSLGMKQRLGIALAILNSPDFVILDEPINGLDPIDISELRDTFKKLSDNGITLLISSHILSELYLLANEFGFLENGKLIKELSKEELDLECSKCLVIKTDDSKKVSVLLEKELNTNNYKVINNEEIRVYDYTDDSDKVSDVLVNNKIKIKGFYESGISLEEYFKEIIKEAK